MEQVDQGGDAEGAAVDQDFIAELEVQRVGEQVFDEVGDYGRVGGAGVGGGDDVAADGD